MNVRCRATVTLGLASLALGCGLVSPPAFAQPAARPAAVQNPATTGAWGPVRAVDPQLGEATDISCPSATSCDVLDSFGYVLEGHGSSWSKPIPTDRGKAPAAISCPTTSFCMVLEDAGGVVTGSGSSWSEGAAIPGAAHMSALSCVSPTFCVAVGGTDAFVFDGSSWTEMTGIVADGVQLMSVSCAARTLCAAGTNDAKVTAFDGTTWSKPFTFPSRDRVMSLSCMQGSCVAAGLVDYAVYDGAAWSAPTPITSGDIGKGFLALSCASATFCIATTAHGVNLAFDGTRWTGQPRIRGTSIDALSCRSTACVAVEFSGDAFAYQESTWSTGVPIDPPRGDPTGLSCPVVSFCAAVDQYGYALLRQDSRWGTPSQVDAKLVGSLVGISCASPTMCVAITNDGQAYRFDGATWNGPTPMHGNGYDFESVSCPETTFCMAVGERGMAAMYDGSSWQSGRFSTDQLDSAAVSCTSASFCVVAASDGDPAKAYVYDHGSWSAGAAVGLPFYAQSVSCASTRFCVMVDAGGNVAQFDGTSWTVASGVTADTSGSMSCPAAHFCAATGDEGTASTYDGVRWSAPVLVDPFGATMVSCASAHLCVTLDQQGFATATRHPGGAVS